MTNEIYLRQAELTNNPSSPKLRVREIYMPDPSSESMPSTPVLERPSAPSRTRSSMRETGERPPPIRGGSPMSIESEGIWGKIKEQARGIDPTRFTSPQLTRIAEIIKRGGEEAATPEQERFLKTDMLEDFGEIVARASADSGVDPEQAVELRHFLRDIITKTNIKEGRAERGRLPQETQAEYLRKSMADNLRKIAALEAMGTTRTEAENRELTERKNMKAYFKSAFEEKLKDLVENLPLQNAGLDVPTIELISESDEALRYLVNRLVAIPLNYELQRYNLGFYGGNNLETVKTYLQTRAASGAEDSERINEIYQRILVVSSSIEFFHGMNTLIVQGNLEGFTRQAENISPEMLQMMQGELGASIVMRLLDQEYELLLARDGWINNDNYGKMMGFEIKDDENGKGRIVRTYKGAVLNKFKEEVRVARETKKVAMQALEEARLRGASEAELVGLRTKVTEAEFNPLADMADWEISWAYNVGKILHNLSLRPAEYISQGKNPPGAEQYASFPQEGMARLMNWMNEMMMRFKVAEARGGVKLTEMTRDNYEALRHDSGYHEVNITKIMGKDISWYELPGVFEVAGPMSSWRQTLMILRQIPLDNSRLLNDKGEKIISESDIEKAEGEKLTIGHILDTGLFKKWWDKADGAKRAELYRSIFLDEHRELRTEINTSLGVMLKNSALAPDHDHANRNKYAEFEAVKLQIREAIWRRVAEDNPLAVLPYLNGLEYDPKKTSEKVVHADKSSKDKMDEKGNIDTSGSYKVQILGEKGEAHLLGVSYEDFYQKLFRINEIRMQRIRREKTYDNPDKGYVSLQDLINEQVGNGKLEWSGAEQQLLDYIKEQGIRAAPEFANVRFNFNPFMNDVLFEQMEYGEAGAEFYRRRAAGDLGSFYKSLNAWIAICNNPGALKYEDIIKHMGEIVDGIGSPHGTDVGQRRVMPMFDAYLEFVSRGSNDLDSFIGIDLKKTREILGKEYTAGKFINSSPVKIVRGYAPVHWVLNKTNKFNSWAQMYSASTHAPALNPLQKEELIHEAAGEGVLGHHQAMWLRKKWSGRFRWRALLYLLSAVAWVPVVATTGDLLKRPFSAGDEFKS